MRQGRGIQGQCYISIPIIVVFLEDISHPLEAYAALNEEVKTDSSLAPFIVRPEERVDEVRTQSIPECYQRICVFVETDISAPVGVKAIEERPPGCQETP